MSVLAVIGPDWLTDRDEHGRRRLDLATDTVRIELATALRRPGPVIPVLVGGAIMPQPEDLPADVATLARRSPIELRDTSWASDVARLRATIVPLGSSPVPVAAGEKSGRRTMLVIIGVLAVLVAGLAAAALLMNGDDDNGTTSSSVTNDDPGRDVGARAGDVGARAGDDRGRARDDLHRAAGQLADDDGRSLRARPGCDRVPPDT